MKVILLGEIKGKGGEGDVVEVAQGFAENYLFPNRLALPATKGNIKQLEERRHNIAKREEKRIADAEALKAALDGKTVLIDAKVGDEGQLFGSVTNQMVADAVKNDLGVEVERKRIELNRAIKTS
ncbi:50S ribosomal protein L9, partial [uncultured Parolsenella sp.]|uniref:50S ribosomal protein L9 n=1 Tax=uncultured Parolsenella sp. TaxID=2083008 RepID=UPI0027D9BBD6